MRYFFVSAVYDSNYKRHDSNLSLELQGDFTNNVLKNAVKEVYPEATNIVIMGIYEFTKEEHENFWK